MRRLRTHAAYLALVASAAVVVATNGCAASDPDNTFGGTGSAGGSGGNGVGAVTSSTGTGGKGGEVIITPDGGTDAQLEDVFKDPCESACGPDELCDPAHLGLDDDCDGLVDEVCGCSAGQAHFCFKGDPHFRDPIAFPACFDGTEVCNEQGQWGPCIGGKHAVAPDNCQFDTQMNCHALNVAPFADVNLKDGTGLFSANAIPGSETWKVTCPANVVPCPAVGGVNPADDYKPLQSGEYTVAYTKKVAGQADPQSCTYPLVVGAPGLRVELSWNHSAADSGVDLDLHVHKPNNTQPWGISPGKEQDCTWSNCVFYDFKPPQGPDAPKWFADAPAAPPSPVNWFIEPMADANTCYHAPRGVGQLWKDLAMGCHNPRLDLDNITCDFDVVDPDSASFCAPENVNIDYPPANQWIRVGVHYYSAHGLNYDVYPEIRIYCNGGLAADLGPGGYYVPEAPITFSPSDGSGVNGNRFWVAADVIFENDECGKSLCTVHPIYSDAVNKTPFYTFDSVATSVFAPAYAPLP